MCLLMDLLEGRHGQQQPDGQVGVIENMQIALFSECLSDVLIVTSELFN